MFDRSQLRKGTLEGLHFADHRPRAQLRLRHCGHIAGKRLCRYHRRHALPAAAAAGAQGLVAASYRASPAGPSRKYYTLTPAGQQTLADFTAAWRETAAAVQNVLDSGHKEE